MKTKLDKSVTFWMLKSTNTNSFLAFDTLCFTDDLNFPPCHLCAFERTLGSEMVFGRYKKNVQEIARQWNKSHKKRKVTPVKVRITLEFISKGANDEN